MILPQSTEAEDIHDPVPDLILSVPLLAKGEGNLIVDDIAADHMVGVLHDKADEGGALARRIVAKVLTIHDNRATVRVEHPHQEAGKGRLARPIGAEDRDHLPRLYREVYAIERIDDTIVGEAKVGYLEHRLLVGHNGERALLLVPGAHLARTTAEVHPLKGADIPQGCDITAGEA